VDTAKILVPSASQVGEPWRRVVSSLPGLGHEPELAGTDAGGPAEEMAELVFAGEIQLPGHILARELRIAQPQPGLFEADAMEDVEDARSSNRC